MIAALLHLALTALSVVLVSKILPGIRVRSYGSAFGFAFAVSIVSFVAWKILGLITVPFAFLTLGIGYFLINACIFMVADKFIDGVAIKNFTTALLASLGVSIINWLILAVLNF